jgi:aminopeptidase N
MLKRFLFIHCAIFGAIFASNAQSDDLFYKDLHEVADAERRNHTNMLDFRSSPFTDNYDLKYHRLEWTIDPAVLYISGAVTSYFEAKTAGFQEINFDLVKELTVSEVLHQGQPLTFIHHDDDRLQIFLPAALSAGQLDSVTVIYAGAPPQTGFGSFNKATHAGVPILWTLSEPYGARDWWPCKQDLSDKIDSIDVLVRTPAAYRVASNGLLDSETEVGTDKIYHWKHRYPIPTYLIAIAVTNYAVYSDFVPVPNGNPIEVLNYVYPEFLPNAQSQTTATVQVMQLYNELFGLYPFSNEKYGHAQFGWGGGMEHQTMSFMGGFSFSLQAHELAHQWFGDKVTCGSWEDIWLKEGFATYLTGLTYENGLGTQNWRNWLQNTFTQITNVPDGSVWVNDTMSVNRIFNSRLTYSKGAMLLHMLRWKLGDEAFFQGVRDYLSHPEQAYEYALTQDLKAHLEAESGQDLTEFLEDWFYGQGHPSYQVQWGQGSSGMVQVTIGQTTSHASVDFYEMPVPIRFSGPNGDTTLVFDHEASGQQFSVALPFEVETAEFDPDLWILSANNTVAQVVVSTKETDLLRQSLRVFPNPVQDELNISFDWNRLPDAVVLYDVQGKQLQTVTPQNNPVSIGMKDLPAGLYVVEIRVGGVVIREKVVKG